MVHVLDALPKDSFTGKVKSRPDLCTVNTAGSQYKATVKLPHFCPLRKLIHSNVHSEGDAAKREACLQALCELLEAELYKASQIEPVVAEIVTRLQANTSIPRDSPHADLARRNQGQSIDLSDPSVQWPRELWVLRFEVDVADTSINRFGLLVTSAFSDFGLAQEFRLAASAGDDVCVAVRATPARFAWPTALSEKDVVELVRRYHQSVLYEMMPNKEMQPSFACIYGSEDIVIETKPTSALLVRLEDEPADAETVHIAWNDMQKQVDADAQSRVALMFEEDEDEDEEETMKGEAEGTLRPQSWPCSPLFYKEDGAVMPTLASLTDNEKPAWLLPLLHRFFRFMELREMAAKSLAGDAPWHPLLLDIVTTLPQARLRQSLFAELQHFGGKVLQAIVSLDMFVRNSTADCVQLERMRDAAMSAGSLARMAQSLPIHSMVLSAPVKVADLAVWKPGGVPLVSSSGGASCSSPHQPSAADSAGLFQAVLAAHYSQQPSGFASAASFYNKAKQDVLPWITGHKADERRGLPAEHVFGHYVAGCEQHFLGDTPTVKEFQEAYTREDGLVLRVCYDFVRERGDPKDGEERIEYIRSWANAGNGGPSERKIGTTEWRVLAYSFSLGTYLTANGRPVPNKIFFWLTGKLIANLIKPKYSDAKTHALKYLKLQERKDGSLLVVYARGAYIYERTTAGGLGTEREPRARPEESPQVIYSEKLKALVSPALEEPLPKTVVEWLQGKCLASVVGTRKGSSTARVKSEDGFDSGELRGKLEGRKFVWRLEHVQGGLLFLESEDASRTAAPQELIYSEDQKSWLSPTLSTNQEAEGVLVPDAVIAWMTKALQQEEWAFNVFQAQRSSAPWLAFPQFPRTMFPKALDVTLIESKSLQYSFKNRLFLVEAMTHPSYQQEGMCGDYQRLAFLGSALVELVLSQELYYTGELKSMTVAQLSPERQTPKRQCDTQAALWAQCEKRSLPSFLARGKLTAAPASDHLGVAGIETAVALCCNHAAYARACVLMDLHKNILHNSPQLQEAIDRFAKAVKAAERSSGHFEELRRVLWGLDAPRALGDVFLACTAAVFLDSNWRVFRASFEPVLGNLLDLVGSGPQPPEADPLVSATRLAKKHDLKLEIKERHVGNTSADELIEFIASRCEIKGHALNVAALARSPPGMIEEENVRQIEEQLKNAFALRDFYLYESLLGGKSLDPPLALPMLVMATSPRVARQRCADVLSSAKLEIVDEALLRLNSDSQVQAEIRNKIAQELERAGRTPLAAYYQNVADEQDNESVADAAETQEPAQDGGAEYCKICDMMLNGPTQMEDHKIGKKHKKNAGVRQSGQGTRAESSRSTSKANKDNESKATAKPEQDLPDVLDDQALYKPCRPQATMAPAVMPPSAYYPQAWPSQIDMVPQMWPPGAYAEDPYNMYTAAYYGDQGSGWLQ